MRASDELLYQMSLVQRNLQTAQTAIDTAEQFMKLIMEAMHQQEMKPVIAVRRAQPSQQASVVMREIAAPDAEEPDIEEPKRPVRGRPKSPSKKDLKKNDTVPGSISDVVRQYMTAHPNEWFDKQAVAKFGRPLGFRYTVRQYAGILSFLKARKKLEGNNKGLYRAIEVADAS